MLTLFLTLAYADPPPRTIELAPRGRVLIDGVEKPISHAKPFLIENAASRPQARRAKTLSTVGTIGAISGAALVVLGSLAISDGGGTTNAAGFSTASAGFVVLGAGIGFKVGSHNKWKRSVRDYQAP